MDEDDAPPSPQLGLDRLSEDELESRIRALKDEIAACEVELEKKRSHRNAADALFGGG
ncbi:MAG: DUF1192 domain-containing protein [Pseudomonadota bacterium]